MLRVHYGDAANHQVLARGGYRPVHYIDDFLFACQSSTEFARVQASVLGDLAAAGLVVSKEKCQLWCSHVVKFLGFVIDTLFGQFRLTALSGHVLSVL
jgi:hypothetical protein